MADYDGCDAIAAPLPVESGSGNGVARKKKKRRKKRYLLKFALAVALGAGLWYFLNSPIFDIREIEVENNAHYSAEQIIDKAGLRIGENLFAASMRDVKRRLAADPYIVSAMTRRRLIPAGVVIRVTERKETAFAPDGKAFIVIDADGVVLRRAETRPTLTELSNLNVTRAEAGFPLEVEQNAALTDALNLMKEVKQHELYFKKISVSNIMVRAYIYDQLICEGAPEYFFDNLEDLRQVILSLDEQGIARGTVKIGGDGYIAWQPVVE